MNFLHGLCSAFESPIHYQEQFTDVLIFVVPLISGLLVALFVFKNLQARTLAKIFAATFPAFIAFVGTFLFLFFIFILLINDQPHAMDYANLNAAIKNTCYLDPNHIHCPQNLDQLIAIEDLKFAPLKNMLTYKYYAETNQYTLIVRYEPYRAVIYDPRLVGVLGWGKTGLDFEEVQVSKCGGDHIINPPNFSGPWNFNY